MHKTSCNKAAVRLLALGMGLTILPVTPLMAEETSPLLIQSKDNPSESKDLTDEEHSTTGESGWIQKNNHWLFVNEDGKEAKDSSLKIGNSWYFFDKNGYLRTGWVEDGGTTYYADSAGAMKTGWMPLDDSWYYFDHSGALKKGWLKDQGKWYVMNEKTGAMETGWLKDGGHSYYLDASGAMKTGWLGSDGHWYYLDNSGAMKTGWLKIDNNWYYMQPENGQMAVDTWLDIDGTGYHFNNDGINDQSNPEGVPKDALKENSTGEQNDHADPSKDSLKENKNGMNDSAGSTGVSQDSSKENGMNDQAGTAGASTDSLKDKGANDQSDQTEVLQDALHKNDRNDQADSTGHSKNSLKENGVDATNSGSFGWAVEQNGKYGFIEPDSSRLVHDKKHEVRIIPDQPEIAYKPAENSWHDLYVNAAGMHYEPEAGLKGNFLSISKD